MLVRHQRAQRSLSAFHIPYANTAVVRPRNDALATMRKGDSADPICVPTKGTNEEGAGAEVLDAESVVARARDDAGAA